MSPLTTIAAILALVTVAHTMDDIKGVPFEQSREGILEQFIKEKRKLPVNDQCTCGGKENIKLATRIIGGEKVPAGKYPWLVYLNRKTSSRPPCVGAIINDKYILTSRSCIMSNGLGNGVQAYHSVRVVNKDGLDELYGKELKIRHYHTKEDYRERTYNKQKRHRNGPHKGKPETTYTEAFDIALIELEDKLTFNDTFYPICLTPKTDIGKDDDLFATGWGNKQLKPSDDLKEEPTDISLAKVDLHIVPKDQCEKLLAGEVWQENLRVELCVQGKKEGKIFRKEIKSGVCVRDKGGPLMTRMDDGRVSMLGVFSHVSDVPKPSTVALVRYNKNWIVGNTLDAVWCKGSPLVEMFNSGDLVIPGVDSYKDHLSIISNYWITVAAQYKFIWGHTLCLLYQRCIENACFIAY